MFLCLCCCLNRCCWGQVASGSRGNVHSHRSSTGFDISQDTARAVKGSYTGHPLCNYGTVVPQMSNCTRVDFMLSTLAPLYLVIYWYVKEQVGNNIVVEGKC